MIRWGTGNAPEAGLSAFPLSKDAGYSSDGGKELLISRDALVDDQNRLCQSRTFSSGQVEGCLESSGWKNFLVQPTVRARILSTILDK